MNTFNYPENGRMVSTLPGHRRIVAETHDGWFSADLEGSIEWSAGSPASIADAMLGVANDLEVCAAAIREAAKGARP